MCIFFDKYPTVLVFSGEKNEKQIIVPTTLVKNGGVKLSTTIDRKTFDWSANGDECRDTSGNSTCYDTPVPAEPIDTTMGEGGKKYRKKSNVYVTLAYNSIYLRKAFGADDFTDVTRYTKP